MFMAEKGFDVPMVQVDIRSGESRREPYLKINPSGQYLALELDDGSVLAEITAICEYVDEKKKDTPSLIGDTPKERAKTRMWTRRIDLNIVEPPPTVFASPMPEDGREWHARLGELAGNAAAKARFVAANAKGDMVYRVRVGRRGSRHDPCG
jgi:glutathione S-transferase